MKIAPPGIRCGDRVDHVVWVVRPENGQSYSDQLARTFRTKFDFVDGVSRGVGYSVYIAWDSGLEIVMPVSTGPGLAALFFDHLESRGESFWGVVYGVSDLNEAADHCRSVGWDVGPLLQSGEGSARRSWIQSWTSSVLDIQEMVIGKFLGVNLLLGEFVYVNGTIRTGQASG